MSDNVQVQGEATKAQAAEPIDTQAGTAPKAEPGAGESPAATLAGARIGEILVNTANNLATAWSAMRDVLEPLTLAELKVAARIARATMAEFSKTNKLTAGAANVYLSEFARCKFNNRPIPEDRKGYKEYTKDASFAKMSNVGARTNVAKQEAKTGTADAAGGESGGVDIESTAHRYANLLLNLERAEAAGLSLDAIESRVVATLQAMLDELAEIEALAAQIDADNESEDDVGSLIELQRTGTDD